MKNKALASAMLFTMLVGCGVDNSAMAPMGSATGLTATSVGSLPIRQVLTSTVIAKATADVDKALDFHIPDSSTTVGHLTFEPTNDTQVLSFKGIEVHYGFAFQYESLVAGTVDLQTGKVTITAPKVAN